MFDVRMRFLSGIQLKSEFGMLLRLCWTVTTEEETMYLYLNLDL